VQPIQLTEAIIELVKAGLGVAFLARWAVAPHLKAGAIRTLSFTSRGYHRTWSAATLKDLARVPYVREFIELLATHPPFAGKHPTKK
jgi:LysR family transcriptional regulator for metE and metH